MCLVYQVKTSCFFSTHQQLGIQGVWRGKNKQTTRSRDDQKRADDLVKRNFNADHPDQLWVADFSVPQQAA